MLVSLTPRSTPAGSGGLRVRRAKRRRWRPYRIDRCKTDGSAESIRPQPTARTTYRALSASGLSAIEAGNLESLPQWPSGPSGRDGVDENALSTRAPSVASDGQFLEHNLARFRAPSDHHRRTNRGRDAEHGEHALDPPASAEHGCDRERGNERGDPDPTAR